MEAELRKVLPFPGTEPKPRWRRWMAMTIPVPFALGAMVIALSGLLVFMGVGIYLGHKMVNGAELEGYESVMKGYRYVAQSLVENCIMDQRMRESFYNGEPLTKVLERR